MKETCDGLQVLKGRILGNFPCNPTLCLLGRNVKRFWGWTCVTSLCQKDEMDRNIWQIAVKKAQCQRTTINQPHNVKWKYFYPYTLKTGTHLSGVQQSISYLTANAPRLVKKEGSVNVLQRHNWPIRGSIPNKGRCSAKRPYGLWNSSSLYSVFSSLLPGVKRPERDTDHVLPSSVNVEND